MRFTFTQHSLQQIFKRGISVNQVKSTVLQGDEIAVYEDDQPYPSKLSLYIEDNFPIHVVYAINEIEKEYIIITAYSPSDELWEKDFKTRKQ